MVFSSIVFLLYFFPIFLLVYMGIDRRYKNATLLIFSLLFYAWGAPEFVYILVGSVAAVFFTVKEMSRSEGRRRRILLWIAIAINLGLLLYFKYANFFLENINDLLLGVGAKEITWTRIVLPIGISFYTFQALSYTIDVYRAKHAPLEKVQDFLLYIVMFPQLIAGPIVRFGEIAEQIPQRTETVEDRLLGAYRFIIGLAKKVLIANVLGAEADDIFSQDYASIDATTAWVGILAYTFQIYYDFSGYSDMAIGIGRMVGFTFPENFNSPYISRSITEFWRRWHITLGAWMRDYLYIPLGGNRVSSNARLYTNLITVFLISGLWHGASWNFVLWGAWHGLFLILDRLFLVKVLKAIGKLPATLFTFLVAVHGWVIFRIEDMSLAWAYLGRMYSWEWGDFSFSWSSEVAFTFLIAFFFAFFTAFKPGQWVEKQTFERLYGNGKHLIAWSLGVMLLILSVASISASGFNPFIYFRF